MLAGVLILFERTALDMAVQDWFFQGQPHQWMVNAKNPTGRMLFYTGPKVLLAVFGGILLLIWAGSFRFNNLRPYRAKALFLVLSLAVVPSVISVLKSTTNVYWPDQLERYGGDKPYVKVFESYPESYHQTKRGYGFPAGHASGGFALMSLWFVFETRRGKALGLSTGLALGWIMGLYQMAKGAHFLSHTLVTMLGAWLMILILYRAVYGWRNGSSDCKGKSAAARLETDARRS
jgi:membrane-associated PAP2 superfamily phosphatase